MSKEIYFEAAHFLREYNGKCENLHGHNWRVRATLAASALDHEELVYDFAALKKHLLEITGTLDHTLVNEVPPFDVRNPSAENIAIYIAEQLQHRVDDGRVWVESVEVWETPTSRAQYLP